MRRLRTALLPTLAVAALAGGTVVWQFATDDDGYARFRPVLASELQARPEGHLFYPKSAVVEKQAADMRRLCLISACEPAWVSTTLGADTSAEELRAWYKERLGELGWQFREPVKPALGGQWQRGKHETFFLYVVLGSSYDYRPITQQTEYRITYGVTF